MLATNPADSSIIYVIIHHIVHIYFNIPPHEIGVIIIHSFIHSKIIQYGDQSNLMSNKYKIISMNKLRSIIYVYNENESEIITRKQINSVVYR